MAIDPSPRFVLAPAASVAPVPPFATTNVPASVIVPLVVIGPPEVVRPVVPPDTFTLETVAAAETEDANKKTAPVLSLAYSFLSLMLMANSPFSRFPAVGTALSVTLW